MRRPKRTQISSVATSSAWMYPSGYISPTGYICSERWNMKTLPLILMSLLTFSVSYASPQEPSRAPTETTEQMVSACRGVADADVRSDGSVQLSDTMNSGLCWGFFSVFPVVLRATYNAHYGASQTYPFRVCVTGGVSVNQLIAVFLDYARRHPERYVQDAFIVELDAMKEAFPCRRAPR